MHVCKERILVASMRRKHFKTEFLKIMKQVSLEAEDSDNYSSDTSWKQNTAKRTKAICNCSKNRCLWFRCLFYSTTTRKKFPKKFRKEKKHFQTNPTPLIDYRLMKTDNSLKSLWRFQMQRKAHNVERSTWFRLHQKHRLQTVRQQANQIRQNKLLCLWWLYFLFLFTKHAVQAS